MSSCQGKQLQKKCSEVFKDLHNYKPPNTINCQNVPQNGAQDKF